MNEVALSLAASDLYVIPVTAQKRPIIKNWPNAASTNPEQIASWWQQTPEALIGVLTGRKSNLLVIDVDLHKPGAAEWLKKHEHLLGGARTHETRNGGRHYLFRYSASVIRTSHSQQHAVDLQFDGAYIVWWPEQGYAVSGPDVANLAAPSDELIAALKTLRPEKKNPFKARPLDDLYRSCPRPEWLVEGVLPRFDVTLIYGASNSGKTFFALDLARHIAAGKHWRDRTVKQGRVVYLCGEDLVGFGERNRAYDQEVGPVPNTNFMYIDTVPNLAKGPDFKEIAEAVNEANGDVLIIDTLAKVAGSADENGSEMSTLINNCGSIAREANCSVVLIHHAGKDESRGARGHSSLEASTQTRIKVSNAEGLRTATIEKIKAGGEGTSFEFSLRSVDLGTNETGSPRGSCVVDHEPSRREKDKGIAGSIIEALSITEMTNESLVKHVMKNRPRTRRDHILRQIAAMEGSDIFLKDGQYELQQTKQKSDLVVRDKRMDAFYAGKM
jgi:hypothetical protein